MVLFGENDYMATVPDRSRSLHNFALPKWGIQRHMKCTKGEFNSDGSGVTSEHQQHQAEDSPPFEIANSSLVIRLRLREANQSSRRLQKSPSKSAEKVSEKEKLEEQEKEKPNRFKISARKENQCEEIVMEERRVSRRKRERSVIAKNEEEIKEIVPEKRTKSMINKDAMEDDVEDQEKEKPNRIRAMKENQSKELTEERTVTRKRGKSEKKESVKLVVPLSKKEIEEDYMQMLGHRPPRRPTKRPRTVQKELENLLPAFHLTEVTLDKYKVEENPQRS